jgi:hypothetical protein
MMPTGGGREAVTWGGGLALSFLGARVSVRVLDSFTCALPFPSPCCDSSSCVCVCVVCVLASPCLCVVPVLPKSRACSPAQNPGASGTGAGGTGGAKDDDEGPRSREKAAGTAWTFHRYEGRGTRGSEGRRGGNGGLTYLLKQKWCVR